MWWHQRVSIRFLRQESRASSTVYGSYWEQNLKFNLRITLCGASFLITWKKFLCLALPSWNMELKENPITKLAAQCHSSWMLNVHPSSGWAAAPFGSTQGGWLCIDGRKNTSSAVVVSQVRKTIFERVQREWILSLNQIFLLFTQSHHKNFKAQKEIC